MTTEAWRPVVGWEGLYEVSDLGRVRSLDRSFTRTNGWEYTRKGQILSPGRIKSGHLTVRLCNRMDARSHAVHRLVMAAFVGRCPDGHEVCHRDGNHKNNTLPNLYYGTRSDNMHDQVRHGVHFYARQTHCKHGHEFTSANTYLRNRPGGGRACKTCNQIRKRARRERVNQTKESA